MRHKAIHIVSFNVPLPADYGGVIDVYYKIKALHEIGVKVYLHCFRYGRPKANELEEICEKVYYYNRKMLKDPLFSRLPYIVASRSNPQLLENLVKDNYPILFEGLHCCYFLDHPDLANRQRIVRMHNLEYEYYKALSEVERNPFKRYFFSVEAERIKRYEKVLHNASAIAAISPEDERLLAAQYENVFYLPAFHSHTDINAKAGRGNYALYHGNLSVGENNQAALYLVREVFNDLAYPFVIAGNNPSRELRKAIDLAPNIKLISNPGAVEMGRLVKEAHINVLPTFQSTGIKLKLIHALYQGRHCLVNPPMVLHTGLERLCHIAPNTESMKSYITKLAQEDFTNEEINRRRDYLSEHFNNQKNALLLADRISVAQIY